jgi:putative oxidoreductase
MILSNIGIILILLFLLVTYLMSAYEKIADWKNTGTFYQEMYKGILTPLLIQVSILFILGFELILVVLIGFALFDFITSGNLLLAEYSFVLSSVLLIILLIGLRLIKDYPGASGIGIYFIISLMGLFWVQYL